MQFFSTIFAACALATLTSAGSVHFVNQDATQRTIIFTQNAGLEAIPKLVIPGMATANQTFPTAWIGNWYSVSDGKADVPGMLGEVAFDAFAGASFFDVSAIVNPSDAEGVKMIFPLHSSNPVSGCQTFPCSNAYNKWDDIATLSSDGNELVCLLGNLSNERRRSHIARHTHEFVSV